MHTNSVLGDKMYRGRKTVDDFRAGQLLAMIRQDYGGVTLHRISAADPTTEHVFLDREGHRAMVGREQEEPPSKLDPEAASDSFGVNALRVASLNVDGCGTYRNASAAERMEEMLNAVHHLELDVLLLQEVTQEMYVAAKSRLRGRGWFLYRKRNATEDYFVVTALRVAADKCTSTDFRGMTQNGRHALNVRRGKWVIVNVHAESGNKATQRIQSQR